MRKRPCTSKRKSSVNSGEAKLEETNQMAVDGGVEDETADDLTSLFDSEWIFSMTCFQSNLK